METLTKDFQHFSAPGRTEIGGNHTDHQRGCVLAAAVNLETTADVRRNNSDEIRIISDGYAPFSVNIHDLSVYDNEKNTSVALLRGVAAAFVQRGAQLYGFDAYVHSHVASGSGLSSSAAFEVLIATVFNHLFLDAKLSAIEIACICQWVENVYFGKPCGLMDQMASSGGGLVYMDFADSKHPIVEQLDFDFQSCEHQLCIIDCGADHADLTDAYADIPKEMCAVAAFLGKDVLRDVDAAAFYAQIPAIRQAVGDRAVLRAMHFFEEQARVHAQVNALRNHDFHTFLQLVNASGISSWTLLQNITPNGYIQHQDIAVALGLARHLLQGQGAVRIHGGGFAGTIQAFVPNNQLDDFRTNITAILGKDSCRTLSIRTLGGYRID